MLARQTASNVDY